MAGDRTRVLLSEPLHGEFPEGRVTGTHEPQERCRGNPTPGVNFEKVSPQGFCEDHAGTVAEHFTT